METNKINIALNTSEANWNNWRWHIKQKASCSNLDNLADLGLVNLSDKQPRRVGLTPYNIKLLLDLKASDPEVYRAEWLQSFLTSNYTEKKHQWVWAKRHDQLSSRFWDYLLMPKFLKTLFFGRGSNTKIKALENMYPNTDVLIATAVCARNCSFCFREVGDSTGEASGMTGGINVVMKAVQEIIKRKTPHVLITGGDPLTRTNEQLRQILISIVQSDTIQVLRLATRMVVDLPMRFYDEELLSIFRDITHQMKLRNASFRIVTQVNHPCELTPEAMKALKNIQSCGVVVMNQTTVLRGVNDNEAVLKSLMMKLDRLGIHNHKLFHSMPVAGSEKLRIPFRKFRNLVASLHQWLPGTSVPQANLVTLVGKIPITPSKRWVFRIPFTNQLLCRSFRGEWYLFKDTWDKIALVFDGVKALSIIGLCIFLLWTHNPQKNLCFDRIAFVSKELGYPDAFSRQKFKPFISNRVLYLPD